MSSRKRRATFKKSWFPRFMKTLLAIALAASLYMIYLVIHEEVSVYTPLAESADEYTGEEDDNRAGAPGDDPVGSAAHAPISLRRPGEAAVSMDSFLACLAERLRVNLSDHTQDNEPLHGVGTGASGAAHIPMIVFPLLYEAGDHRALVCSMDPHVTFGHVVYVQNAAVTYLSVMMDAIEATFTWTGRVTVRRYPENIGLAGAMNAGLHEMLLNSLAQVPFCIITQSTVRFHGNLLRTQINAFHDALRGDAPVMQHLEAAVAREKLERRGMLLYNEGMDLYKEEKAERADDHAVARQRNSTQRPPYFYYRTASRTLRREEWDPNATFSTALLLPDSIRYLQPPEARASVFAGHIGLLYFTQIPNSASIGVSRLAASTVGYFDENYFPGGGEGQDYHHRHTMLGFSALHASSQGPSLEQSNGSLLQIAQHLAPHGIGRRDDSTGLLRLLGGAKRLQETTAASPDRYSEIKWLSEQTRGQAQRIWDSSPFQAFKHPLPLDAWVRDIDRRDALRKIMKGGTVPVSRLRYNGLIFDKVIAGGSEYK